MWLLIPVVRRHFRDGRIYGLFDYNANPEAFLWQAFGLCHPGPLFGYEAFGGLCWVFCAGNSRSWLRTGPPSASRPRVFFCADAGPTQSILFPY